MTSIYTKGLGLRIEFDPSLVPNFFKSQYKQEQIFDENIRRFASNITINKIEKLQKVPNFEEFMT